MITIAKRIGVLSLGVMLACSGSNQNQMNTEESEGIEVEMDDLTADSQDENEREVTAEAIPGPAMDDIKARFTSYEIDDVDEVTHEDGSITYDIEIKTSDGDFELEYSSSGEFVSLEEGDDDENEENE